MPIQNAFTLTANEIFTSLANMFISQQVFADNLGKHQTLVDKARVDGSMYGDTKLYYSTDVLESHEWLGDAEASFKEIQARNYCQSARRLRTQTSGARTDEVR